MNDSELQRVQAIVPGIQEQEALTEVMGSFDKVAKDDVNPGHLHN